MKKCVFIYESIRDQYTIAAVIVPITKVAQYRKEMSNLRTKGARTFHMGQERRHRQQNALRRLASLEYCSFIVATSAERIQAIARQQALLRLLRSLEPSEYQLLFDQTNQDSADRETILQFRLVSDGKYDFMHLERSQDSGLWGADIVAWLAGTSGESLLKIRKTP